MVDDKKREKLAKKAQHYRVRAEAYAEAGKTDKAAKVFEAAGDGFVEVDLHADAEDCYFLGAKATLQDGRLAAAADLQRKAANACLMQGHHERAESYYQVATKYYLRAEKAFDAIVTGSFAFLCLFVRGFQDKALAYVKRLKKQVPFREFRENKLVQLVRSLTVATTNGDLEELDRVEEQLRKFKFRVAENALIDRAVDLARLNAHSVVELDVPAGEYLIEQLVPVTVTFDTSPVLEAGHEPLSDTLFVTDAGLATSDNLSVKAAPDLPVAVRVGEKVLLEFSARVNFPDEASFVGPAVLTCEVRDGTFEGADAGSSATNASGEGPSEGTAFRFFAKTGVARFVTKSPPTRLGVNLKAASPPIIGQSFPLEFILSNASEGEATNVEISVEFPPELRVTRGTTSKTIFSLPPGQELRWVLSLKPKEPGTFPIKVTLTFLDSNGVQVGPQSAELPFEVRL
ncbi:MAG: hypothetical protein Kow0069_05880 [Promethearchaeota archaeon]